MDGILVLAGLVILAIPVAVLYLLVSLSGAKSDLKHLRAQVLDLEADIAALRDHAPTAQPPPGAQTEARAEPSEAAATPPADAAAPPAAAVISARAARTPPPPRGHGVLNQRLGRLTGWFAANWFYAVSAMSLALAGLFLVQYGVENGLLPPVARVAAALGFGAVLIAVGEIIRRRFGDDPAATTAYLPSVFSGAGIVSLFGGVLAARLLYDLIGPDTALAGMVAVALVGLVLGWFHGPLLAAVGVVGAFAAPFVVGGSSDDPSMFYAYFALIAALGLGIDTLKRWAWVSALSVGLGYAAGWMLVLGDATTRPTFAVFAVALALLALLIPARSLFPDHQGAQLHQTRRTVWPIFPTLLAGGALAATSAVLWAMSQAGSDEFWLCALALAMLAGLWTISSARAPALQDQALLPLAGLAATVAVAGLDKAPVRRAFDATYAATQEADFPLTVTVLVALGLILSLLAAWRSMRGGAHAAPWAAAAALIAPGLAIVIEITWRPATVLGAYSWALHAAALGVVMVVLAERFARRDGAHRLRTAFFVLSALSALTFALVLILTLAALTAAIAVTVVVAAALDRRFDLPQMGAYIAAGVATLGYRLLADPGLDWGLDAALPEVLLAYGGAFAAMVTGLWVLRPRDRAEAALILDSAAWSMGGLLVSLLIFRAIAAVLGDDDTASHWAMGLFATIWFGLAIAQVQRMPTRRALRWVRAGLGALFALIGLGALALGALLFSPLLTRYFAEVAGPPVLNTLIPAYLLPAGVLILGALRLRDAPRWLRAAMLGLGGLLSALWLVCVIRHVWQGPGGMPLSEGIGQYELYTYTVVLLMFGAGLFYQSLARGLVGMRRASLVVIGLAVAKVFLIDISGLGGLTRVFSLLILGLSLAGLAWLNRWAQDQTRARGGAD